MKLARYYTETGMEQAPKRCPITGVIDCQRRTCELHYMDAPLKLDSTTPLDSLLCASHPELPPHFESDCDRVQSVEWTATRDRDYLD